MKKNIFLALLFLSCSSTKSLINQYEKEIDQLQSKEDIKGYWENIYKLDQQFRGIETSDINDMDNLMKTCLMINKHGYPRKAEFGFNASTAPWIVWAHNPSFESKRIAFPIITEALKNESIPPGLYPSYFLRGIFTSKFGREFNGDYEIESVNKFLDLNLSKEIDIKELKNAMDSTIKFRKLKITKSYGNYIQIEDGDTLRVSIHQKENLKYYYDELYDDRSYSTQELIPINDKLTQYKFAINLYNHEFRIINNELQLLDESDKIISKFYKEDTDDNK